MAEAADTNTTTVTSTEITVNRGYPTSWQGILKIFKMVCLFACLVCSAIIVNRYSHPDTQYCVAISVIGFIMELVIFVLYALGVNSKWPCAGNVCAILFLVYHLLMGILLFAACIIMTGWGGWRVSAARAFNAFGIFALAGFALDIYFNIIWLRGGPELAAFSSI